MENELVFPLLYHYINYMKINGFSLKKTKQCASGGSSIISEVRLISFTVTKDLLNADNQCMNLTLVCRAVTT